MRALILISVLNFYTINADKKTTLNRARELLGAQGVSKEASCSP